VCILPVHLPVEYLHLAPTKDAICCCIAIGGVPVSPACPPAAVDVVVGAKVLAACGVGGVCLGVGWGVGVRGGVFGEGGRGPRGRMLCIIKDQVGVVQPCTSSACTAPPIDCCIVLACLCTHAPVGQQQGQTCPPSAPGTNVSCRASQPVYTAAVACMHARCAAYCIVCCPPPPHTHVCLPVLSRVMSQ
jgi:hypothetical protein